MSGRMVRLVLGGLVLILGLSQAEAKEGDVITSVKVKPMEGQDSRVSDNFAVVTSAKYVRVRVTGVSDADKLKIVVALMRDKKRDEDKVVLPHGLADGTLFTPGSMSYDGKSVRLYIARLRMETSKSGVRLPPGEVFRQYPNGFTIEFLEGPESHKGSIPVPQLPE